MKIKINFLEHWLKQRQYPLTVHNNWRVGRRRFTHKIRLLISSFLIVSFSSHAAFKTFEAPIDQSKWQFYGNPTHCNLSHSIPYYGDAKFHKVAGKNQPLEFNIEYMRQPIPHNQSATVIAIAPSWRPNQQSRILGEVKLTPGNQLISNKNIASWQLLNELEIGRFPTFTYQDFTALEDQVAVSLSSVGFQDAFGDFLDCLASLVPYQLEELKNLTFYFDFDRAAVKEVDRSKLIALAAFIKYDPSIEVVFIKGYTDSKGSRYYNEKLSQKRVDSVKQMLQLEGVDDNRFNTQALGEKHPKSTNRNAKGRAQNRRVYVKIAQK